VWVLAVNPDALAYTIGYWHEHANMNTMPYAHADAYLSQHTRLQCYLSNLLTRGHACAHRHTSTPAHMCMQQSSTCRSHSNSLVSSVSLSHRGLSAPTIISALTARAHVHPSARTLLLTHACVYTVSRAGWRVLCSASFADRNSLHNFCK
jgi:hypothetical protein